MTYPIQPEPPFWAANTLLGRTTLFCADVYRLLSSGSSMAPWGKQFNSWTPWLFFLDQGFPVENGLDTFNTPHTRTTLCHPKIGYVDCDAESHSDTSYFTSGQHFLETCTLLPETTRATKSRWLQRLFPQTANMTFATYGEHISLVRPTMP